MKSHRIVGARAGECDSLPYVVATARILMALVFVISGLSKVMSLHVTIDDMEALHVPGLLLWPIIVFELCAGLFVMIGFHGRIVALLLVAYCLLTALLFHLHIGEPLQAIMFLKNVSMAGGFLLLACAGPGEFSIDARF